MGAVNSQTMMSGTANMTAGPGSMSKPYGQNPGSMLKTPAGWKNAHLQNSAYGGKANANANATGTGV